MDKANITLKRFENRCSNCNSIMDEVELIEDNFEQMTEGQLADYEAGFNREFYCPKCKTTELRDVEIYDFDEDEIEEVAELIKKFKDFPEGIEQLIDIANKKESYIESISLIHNAIELNLKCELPRAKAGGVHVKA